MKKDLAQHNIKVKKEGGEAVISGSIAADTLESNRSKTLDFFRNHMNLDGFRKGNIPDSILLKTIPETTIYEEMARESLADLYPIIIEAEKLQVIGRPKVTLTKVVPGQDIEFEIETALMPDVSLPDYKKVAKELKKQSKAVEVTDEEVERSVLEVRKVLAQRKASADQGDKKGGAGPEAGEESKKDGTGAEEKEPPELTDKDVQEIGPYKTVEEFKKSVHEDLTRYKQEREEEKSRVELADALVEKSDITLPSMLIESEIGAMEAQFEENLKRSGLKADEYLTHIKKTREDLREEWKPEAEKRAKLQLILNKIAAEENLTPDKEAVKKEVDHILSHDASIPRDRAEIYVETTLQNKAVFDFLENLKSKK